ncbi:MAG: ECF transporter S component [Eubacteriales bacterium]|nr:ECF transporter S component [Eubacteriales bacterium]
MNNKKLLKLTLAAVMAALSYVVFTFLQIKITLPGGDATSFHLGNAVCVLGALLLGGVYGGAAGAIGMTIGDLFDPVYVIYAPKTFLLKFCIGLITGLVAHKFGKITQTTDKKHIVMWTLIAAICGMLFNFIFDPLIGYLYKIYIIGKSAAEVTLAWNVLTTGVNAVASVIVATLVYLPIRKALVKTNLFFKIGKENE